jgi:hypothetical protein
MLSLKETKDMKEMKDSLQDYLLKVVDETDEDEDQGNDKKIKTYIIESNIDAPEKISHTPKNSIIKKTDNPNLKIIYLPEIRIKKGTEKQLIYLDSSDPRFWLLHTNVGSTKMRGFVNELVNRNNSQLDFAWFASNFLENKCDIGIGEGFGLKYQNSFLNGSDLVDDGPIRRFSMLFWGGKPQDVLGGLKTNPGLVSGVNLSRVKRLFKTEDGYVKENISREGQFTLTKGDSIDSHFLAVDNVKMKYESIINTIENDYRINFTTSEQGYSIKGTYSVIKLERKIENFKLFLDHILSGNKPFRIIGLPSEITSDFANVFAIDLHTNHKFNMEITPNAIRVYLYKDSCGNVLTRLMTNLQQYYDSQIKLMVNGNEQLI